jgi:hypothetical protein
MEINSLNPTLENIIRRAKVLKWCVTYGCSTCGAHKFRAALKNSFTRDQLIEELKKLSAECVDDVTNRDVLILLMHEVVFLENFTGLSSELAGTNVGEFLDRAVRIEHERRLDTKIRIENEQIAKKMKDKKNAQKNIWGAIKRKDFKAISQLLSYNLDLDENGPLGISLGEALKQIQS